MRNTNIFPKLRFNGFTEEWSLSKIEEFFDIKNGLNKEKEFFGKGTPIINFLDVYNLKVIRNKNIKGLVEVNASELNRFECKVGDVFFTRTSETIDDIGMSSTLVEEIPNCVFSGFVLRARPKDKTFEPLFTSHLFNTEQVRREITTKSSYTTRALTSGTLLNKVLFHYPKNIKEQQKIATFLTTIDTKLQALKKKKELFEQYKKGVVQKIFSQELRFKDENGNEFPNWEFKRLGEISSEHQQKNLNNAISEVFSVAKHKGVINQIEHLGRSYSAKEINHYKIINPGDLVYTKSPTSDFPFGIIKQNRTNRTGVVSPLYCVFQPITIELGFLLHEYFLSSINTYNYLNPLVQKGAKNTMNINNEVFLNGAKINLPMNHKEQKKIVSFVTSFDKISQKLDTDILLIENWKKGLLQNLFV